MPGRVILPYPILLLPPYIHRTVAPWLFLSFLLSSPISSYIVMGSSEVILTVPKKKKNLRLTYFTSNGLSSVPTADTSHVILPEVSPSKRELRRRTVGLKVMYIIDVEAWHSEIYR